MKFNLKQVKYKNILEYKTIRVEKVFWVTIKHQCWTDSIGKWGRIPMAILDYLCLTLRAHMAGEESQFFHVFHWPPHVPWSPTQNKQIRKKMNNFVVVVCYWGSNPESCICAAKCWLHHPALMLFFFNPFMLFLIERSTLLLMWKTGCTLIEWHMTFLTVRHRTSLEWLSRCFPLMKGS